MDYYIKEVTKDEAYDYLYVNTHSWDETYRGLIPDEFIDKILNELDKNVERLRNKYINNEVNIDEDKRFILYLDNEPVGMFSVCKARDEDYLNAGELASLYLLKKAQKKGLGKVMVEYAIEELRKMGYSDMIIGCLKGNPTNEFYKHMGGKLVKTTIRNIHGNDLDENVYYLNILKFDNTYNK